MEAEFRVIKFLKGDWFMQAPAAPKPAETGQVENPAQPVADGEHYEAFHRLRGLETGSLYNSAYFQR